MVLINGSQIQLPNDYQRNIEYISTKRIWGGVCRGEIYTFRKKIFLYEKDGSLMEKNKLYGTTESIKHTDT